MASFKFTDWQWASEHVQVELKNGEYVSAESTLMLAGPSRLAMALNDSSLATAGQSLYPIGLIQMFQIAQNRQVARLFEIGSKRSYFVPGRLFSNFQMNRILFFGPSLLRLLYAVAPIGSSGQGQPFNFAEAGKPPVAGQSVQTPKDYKELFPDRVLKNLGFLNAPGYGAGTNNEENRDFFINLASELFNIPFGICLVTKDARQRPYGAFYLEDMMIEAHTWGVDSNNIVIAEGCNGQFDMVVPLQLQAPPRVA